MSTGEFCPKCRKYYGEEAWHCRCHIVTSKPAPASEAVDGKAVKVDWEKWNALAPQREAEAYALDVHGDGAGWEPDRNYSRLAYLAGHTSATAAAEG